MIKLLKSTVKRQKRTDDTLHLSQSYSGELDTPSDYNMAIAQAMRAMADRIEMVKNAFVDPEFVIWMHAKGRITAEVTLSPIE